MSHTSLQIIHMSLGKYGLVCPFIWLWYHGFLICVEAVSRDQVCLVSVRTWPKLPKVSLRRIEVCLLVCHSQLQDRPRKRMDVSAPSACSVAQGYIPHFVQCTVYLFVPHLPRSPQCVNRRSSRRMPMKTKLYASRQVKIIRNADAHESGSLNPQGTFRQPFCLMSQGCFCSFLCVVIKNTGRK